MNSKFIIILILVLISIIFISLSVFAYIRDHSLKNKSTEHVIGTVVSYANREAKPPVVEYIVNQTTYTKAMRYSYISHISTPFSPIKTFTKSDLLDTKLKLKNNRFFSVTTLIQDEFPLGSTMNVYYNPNNPKQSYVERFAPTYMWMVFLFSAFITTFLVILYSVIL